jgi:hypothetical protein
LPKAAHGGPMTDLATNVLSYADNLDILRRYLPDAAVDLVYLDPPFNSNRDDNVIFRDESGERHRRPSLTDETALSGLAGAGNRGDHRLGQPPLRGYRSSGPIGMVSGSR